MIKLYHGDCLELMKDIPDKSIDLILCDLPYGTTVCSWDTIIPFEPLWQQYKRMVKDNSVVCLFGAELFSSNLRLSNIAWWKYDFIWKKSKSPNFVHAKNMPLKFHEIISIFSQNKIGHTVQLNNNRMTYNPQGLIKIDKEWKRKKQNTDGHHLTRKSHLTELTLEFSNYPTTILDFGNSDNSQRKLHPTQKPVALLEYLIKTYTNEGQLVLDNCMGSGSTGIACLNTNRNFIGIELDQDYFNIASERINKHQQTVNNTLDKLL